MIWQPADAKDGDNSNKHSDNLWNREKKPSEGTKERKKYKWRNEKCWSNGKTANLVDIFNLVPKSYIFRVNEMSEWKTNRFQLRHQMNDL